MVDKSQSGISQSNPAHKQATGVVTHLSSNILIPEKKALKSGQPPLLTEHEITSTLNNLKQADFAAEEAFLFDKARFIKEAQEYGIQIVSSIDELSVANFEGSVLVTDSIGKNSRITVRGGGIAVLGEIEYGVMIDVNDKLPTKTASGNLNSNLGITVVSKIGDHVRLSCSSNIIIQDTGNFVQLRAGIAIKAGNIGAGANLIARDIIEASNIDDDLRSTHYVNQFKAKNIGKRSIVKAGNIIVADIGSGSELIASYHIEADHVDENCIVTARSISIASVAEGSELNAALGISDRLYGNQDQ